MHFLKFLRAVGSACPNVPMPLGSLGLAMPAVPVCALKPKRRSGGENKPKLRKHKTVTLVCQPVPMPLGILNLAMPDAPKYVTQTACAKLF